MSFQKKGVVQISELTNRLIDPVLARRAGIDTALLGSWDEIVGQDFADCTRPEKIAWSRRGDDGDGGFRPGVLTIACEGARALFLTHAQGELIHRINGFFGYPAVHQIRIVQKPVSPPPKKGPRIRPLDRMQKMHLEGLVQGIAEDKLKAALTRLGTAVMGSKKAR